MAGSSRHIRLSCYVKRDTGEAVEVSVPTESLQDHQTLKTFLKTDKELLRRLTKHYGEQNWRVLSHDDTKIEHPSKELTDYATVVLGRRDEATIAPVEVRAPRSAACSLQPAAGSHATSRRRGSATTAAWRACEALPARVRALTHGLVRPRRSVRGTWRTTA